MRGGQPAPHPRVGVHRLGVSQELVRSVLVRVKPDLGGGVSVLGGSLLQVEKRFWGKVCSKLWCAEVRGTPAVPSLQSLSS